MEENKQPTVTEDCTDCQGTGKVYQSCCGDDVYGTIYEDLDLCPTCKEHIGGEQDCETCNGTGKVEVKNEKK